MNDVVEKLPKKLSNSPTQAQSLNTILAARARLNQEAAPVDELRSIIVDPTIDVGIVSGLTNLFNPQGVISEISKQTGLSPDDVESSLRTERTFDTFLTLNIFFVGIKNYHTYTAYN